MKLTIQQMALVSRLLDEGHPLMRRVDGPGSMIYLQSTKTLRKDLRQDLAQRFAAKRDILASLEHPNIARVDDAGIDDRGCPYLAMEYVITRLFAPL